MKSRLNRLEQLCDIVSLEEGLLDKGKDLLRRYDKDQRFIRGLVSLLWQQNTANLYTLVDLINKSNEQQDELIAIIADILTIAKAKDKKEAESIYKKVMAKITQTVKDGETLAKVVGYATTVYELAKPIIENLKV